MTEERKKTRTGVHTVVALIAAAYLCRLPGMLGLSLGELGTVVSGVRSAIYILLFGTWGLSVSQRVIDRHTRGRFVAAACLMVFWVAVRSIKFLSPVNSTLGRYCWYLYYIPMLFIPLLTALIAAFMGRAESEPIPRWSSWLALPAGAIALFVLTNDLHGLVFVFPGGVEHYIDGVYRYGVGFLLPAVWRYGGLLATLALVFFRSRLPNRGQRFLAPVIPALLLVVYHILYLSGAAWLRLVLGDMTVAECLLVVCILEACLSTGLIQSNTHYTELFRGSSTGAVILDRDYRTVAAADNYAPIPEKLLRSAESAPVMLGDHVRLSSAPITDGRVFWTEDISELVETMDKLAEVEAFLAAKRDVAEREMASSRQKHRVVARKDLYDSVMSQTREEILRYGDLTEALEEETDPEKLRLIVLRITVICAYIKRKISLIFQAGDNGEISADQFDLCVRKETLPCICGGGAVGEYSADLLGTMPIGTAIAFYHAFYATAMAALDSLEHIHIKLTGRKGDPRLVLRVICDSDLSRLAGDNVRVRREGREWILAVKPEGGGAR